MKKLTRIQLRQIVESALHEVRVDDDVALQKIMRRMEWLRLPERPNRNLMRSVGYLYDMRDQLRRGMSYDDALGYLDYYGQQHIIDIVEG
jgi:hypothetical protein